MNGLYVAVRREEHWTGEGIWYGKPGTFQYSTSEERCWISGWRARLILRLAGLNPKTLNARSKENG